MTNFALRLDDAAHEALSIYAAITGRSMNTVINSAVAEYLVAHRDEEFTAALADTQQRYAQALEQLAAM